MIFQQHKLTTTNHLSHASIRSAKKTMLYLNHQWAVPRSMSIDGMLCYGGGTGVGLNLARKSFGEYYERDHFFNAVPVHQRGLIEQLVNPELWEKYTDFIRQLSAKTFRPQPLDFTQVINFKTQEPELFFYNGISLKSNPLDIALFPYSDSCACAVHNNLQASLASSLLEFIERQAFLGSWLSQQINYQIKPEVLFELTPYTQLISDLLDNGELYIFNNGLAIPGHSVVMFYFAHHKADRVQYSIGASAGFNIQDALISAFEELWQCYAFLYNITTTKALEEKAGSSYHMQFLQYNQRSTKEVIPYFNSCRSHAALMDIKELRTQPVFSLQSMLAELISQGESLLYYHHHDQKLGLHFTKIVSPDYFAHMALDKPLNINNQYMEESNYFQLCSYT